MHGVLCSERNRSTVWPYVGSKGRISIAEGIQAAILASEIAETGVGGFVTE